MSACLFLASDMPLPEAAPSQEYPCHIDLDNGRFYDGGADDNYFLIPFADVTEYTCKNYGISLEWNYTDGRARQIMEYIRTALQESEAIEFWHVWLQGYYEFEDRPFVHRKTVSVGELTVDHIKEINNAVIWNRPDRMYPERPSFYCLTIMR